MANREALSRLIDKEHEAAARCQSRGQSKAAQRHLERAARFMAQADQVSA